jgi:hypothetical protein
MKIIPSKANCEICEKVILLRSKKKQKSIHFDHRNGGKEPIKGRPLKFKYFFSQ